MKNKKELSLTFVRYHDSIELLIKKGEAKKLVKVVDMPQNKDVNGEALLSFATSSIERILSAERINIDGKCYNKIATVDYRNMHEKDKQIIDSLKMDQLNDSICNLRISKNIFGSIAGIGTTLCAGSLVYHYALGGDSTKAIILGGAGILASGLGIFVIRSEKNKEGCLIRERTQLVMHKLNI